MAKPQKGVRRSGDAAGVGPYARERERLVSLGELRGWNVVDGESDIRSWEVRTLSGKVLGNVRELLVDADAGEVVMIDVDLAGSDLHAFLPIRLAEIDRARRIVRADSGDLEEADGQSDAGRGARVASQEGARQGTVRYADGTVERVVDRRPVVEETVVRRRQPDAGDSRIDP
jgi:PRC-barrel domain protein